MNKEAIFEPLYKKNSKGKIQVWKISVMENPDHSAAYDIWVDHGQLDGKMQQSVDTIFEGKNIGKANETTPYQQAVSEARSKWTKQQERKGYKMDIAKLDVDERPGVEPMLAHRYDKYPDKITFPCFIQPKLDGHRCLSSKDGMHSRQRKPIIGLPHLSKDLSELNAGKFPLDGELYNHDYKHEFEKLTSFIRSETPKEGHEAVEYHIYDIVAPFPFADRNAALSAIAEKNTSSHIKFVETRVANSHAEVLAHFKDFLGQGYEGAILRNYDGVYEHKRSYNLQKVKQFEDAEFTIVGVDEGRGAMKGHAILVCETPEGKTFKAKPDGPMEDLKEIFENKENYIGKSVTVQYQGLTKDKIPRFPVAHRLREDI